MARVASLGKVRAMPESPRGREELVEVAVELFARHGYAGTSIRDIADAVGRSVSNVYHYFENKEALWFAILERSIKTLPDRLREALPEALADPRARFEALVRRHLEATEQYRREARIFFIDEERLSPAGNKANKRVQKEILDIYMTELGRMKAAGLMAGAEADGDVRLCALNVLGVINWYLRWSRPGDTAAKRAQTVDQVLGFVMRAVSVGPDRDG